MTRSDFVTCREGGWRWDRLPALHQSGKVNIVLKLTDVALTDRTGLSDCWYLGSPGCARPGGKLALLNLNRSLEQEAVNSFFPARLKQMWRIADPNATLALPKKPSGVSTFDQTVEELFC